MSTSRSFSRSSLALEIAVILALKCVALFAIWSIWFSAPPRFDLERIAPATNIHAVPHDARP
jgi:hypothetical protein